MTKQDLIDLWDSPVDKVTAYAKAHRIPLQEMLRESGVMPRTYNKIRAGDTYSPNFTTARALVFWMLEKERVI